MGIGFPDLGDYAVPVLSAYAVTLGLIGGLVLISVLRARRVKAALRRLEGNDDG